MWDAVNGGFLPQPWHHNIIPAWPYPMSSKIQPHLHTYYGYNAHPQHLKVLKHFVYIQCGCGMQSMGVFSLNHDTTTSYRLGHTPFPLKFNHICTRIMAIRVYPYAHPQHTSNMDVGCSQWRFAASTITPQHHTSGSAISQSVFPKFTPTCTNTA